MNAIRLITSRLNRLRDALAHSLRVRLVALFLLFALAVTGTFLFGMRYVMSIGWRDAARPVLVDYVDRLTAEIGTPPSIERAQALVQRLPVTVRISGPTVNWRSRPEASERDARWRDSGSADDWQRNEPRLLQRTLADGHHIEFGMVRPFSDNQPRVIAWLTLATLLLLTALAYAQVRRMLRPLDHIRAGALRFGRGEFVTPIAVQNPTKLDELSELAVTINTMGSDIQQMLDAKRALLLAISHELRSPLTRVRLNTELLPETIDVTPCRDALLRDVAVMSELIADLLESERLASPHVKLQHEAIDINTLVLEVAASLPGGASVTQVIASDLPVMLLDRARVRLLLRNLLDNALRHSAQATQPPTITVDRLGSSGGISIRLRDYGPGVPEQQLPHLAEPFYRGDNARERSTGGVGLGLHLCRLVVLAHGGTFSLRNAHPGLEVNVVLPNNATAPPSVAH
ncbi:MAG: HAMP domain-containing protein [Rhizobacter sp.]|nr:HAMP domain-containing protein [Burkholderiales bacterium]